MYYLLNLIFDVFLILGIGLVYTKEVSSGFVIVFLMIAVVANFFASAYATSKYNALADHIMKLKIKRRIS